MDFLFDPAIWAGLLTLIVLEIVLGIDNLVFVAILAKKLPADQQNRAVYTGLSMALLMRIGLLSIMSWLVTLTTPLFRSLSTRSQRATWFSSRAAHSFFSRQRLNFTSALRHTRTRTTARTGARPSGL